MEGYLIPTVTNTYNVYERGNALIGLSDGITLAGFNALTEEMSGSGILGKIEEAVMGHFENQEVEISFRNLDKDIFSYADPTKVIILTFRVAQQQLNRKDASAPYRGIRIVIRGKMKSFEPGVLKQGGQMGSKLTLTLLYILIEIDGETMIELDKLNQIYRVKDKDIMEEMLKFC